PVDLESFELVLLRRPEDATAYPDEELARIQQEHLAYHAGLREAGQVVTNGPVIDGPDPSLRGLAFYRTGSLARARELAEADPAAWGGGLPVGAWPGGARGGRKTRPGGAAPTAGRGPPLRPWPRGRGAGRAGSRPVSSSRRAPGPVPGRTVPGRPGIRRGRR